MNPRLLNSTHRRALQPIEHPTPNFETVPPLLSFAATANDDQPVTPPLAANKHFASTEWVPRVVDRPNVGLLGLVEVSCTTSSALTRGSVGSYPPIGSSARQPMCSGH